MASQPSDTELATTRGARLRNFLAAAVEFLAAAVEPLLFLITAAVATGVGTCFIADPHAVHINAKGPWLYALGILIAFTAYGALTSLTDALLYRGDDTDQQ